VVIIRRYSLSAVFLAFYLVGSIALSAEVFIAEADVAALRATGKVGEGVIERLREASKVAVVVYFAPHFRDPGRSSGERRRAVGQRADALLEALPPGEFFLRRRYRAVNLLALDTGLRGIQRLAARPGVQRIDLEMISKMHLAQSIPLSDIDELHDFGIRGAGIQVAVIDSGVDTGNADFAGAIIAEQCFCINCCPDGGSSQSGAGAAVDTHGHGTNMTGVIAANGAVAGPGAAPDSEIIAVKVSNASGDGIFTSDVIAALDWIVDERPDVDVVNISLGSERLYSGNCDTADATTRAYASVIDALHERGVLTVVASGNDGSATQMAVPACIANALSVGAVWDANLGRRTVGGCTDKTTAPGKATCFSNSNSVTDLFAPGAAIKTSSRNDGAQTIYGTSPAAAMVTGCIADVLSADESLTADEVEAALKASPDIVIDGKNGLSFPLLNCADAVPDGIVDVDGDGIWSHIDNCPDVANADQADTDGDGEGDSCDGDDDSDGVPDAEDDFPLDAEESVDTDDDGMGDNADTDDDEDGVPDIGDAFPLDPDESSDGDTDGVGDNADNCVEQANLDQLDTDNDGQGDVCDSDADNDGLPNSWEMQSGLDPLDPGDSADDADWDGLSNLQEFNLGTDPTDADTDGDGLFDNQDALPLEAAPRGTVIGDLNNNGGNEYALLRAGSVEVEIRDGKTGWLIRKSDYHGTGFEPAAIISIPDLNGNNLAEIGALGVTDDGKIKLRIAEAKTNVQIGKYSFYTSGHEFVDLQPVADISGNALADVALLVTRTSDEAILVQVRDAVTGSKVDTDIAFLNAGFTAKGLVVLPDLDGNGVEELGVFATRDADGRGLVEIREADGSGGFNRIWYLDTAFTPLSVVVGDDTDNNGIPEIAMLAARNSDQRIVIERRNASGAPQTTRHWYFSAGWQVVDFTAVSDTNADNLPEYAVLAIRNDGKPAVEIRNAGNPKAPFRRFFMDKNFTALQVVDMGDTNGNGGTNLGVLGLRNSDDLPKMETRDTRGSSNTKNIWFSP
jgi:hypothetical protein